jgi:hypothetical protein
MRRHRNRIAAGAVALLALTGGGAAIAATNLGSPEEESQAIVDDVAQQLGIESSELSDALEQALANRVDEAVEAGDLTEAQAAELKARIASGDFPLLGLGRGFGHGPGGHVDLETAASYLGVTTEALRTSLRSGESLADVAGEEGKSLAGLVAALVEAEQEELDEAVADGRLTEAQRDSIAADLEARITERVNGTLMFGPGHGPPGLPPGSDAGAA